jgi:hypothetical protein
MTRRISSSSSATECCGPVFSSLFFITWIALVGQRVTTSFTRSVIPCSLKYAREYWWFTCMLSRQVPMVAKSERWMAFTQSFGQPENLNLNLYGSAGRCMSSRFELITSRSARCSS